MSPFKEGQQFIKSNWFNPKDYGQALQRVNYKTLDYIKQSKINPTAINPEGILCEFQNLPLAYYQRPTLNLIRFEFPTWRDLRNSEDIKSRMFSQKNFWGEGDHSDSTEIHLLDVTHKISDFYWLDPQGQINLSYEPPEGEEGFILGNLQVVDTPNGFIVYSLAKSGAIGTSSRGWGTLINAGLGDGTQIVSAKDYYHLCWDLVARPAVPEAAAIINSIQSNKKLSSAFNDFYCDSKGCVVPEFKPIFDSVMEHRPRIIPIPQIKSSITMDDAVKAAGDDLIFEADLVPTTNEVQMHVNLYKKDKIGKSLVASFDAVIGRNEDIFKDINLTELRF